MAPPLVSVSATVVAAMPQPAVSAPAAAELAASAPPPAVSAPKPPSAPVDR